MRVVYLFYLDVLSGVVSVECRTVNERSTIGFLNNSWASCCHYYYYYYYYY